MTNKKYILKIDSSSWYRAHESAYLKITSPSGKTVTLYKKKMPYKGADELRNLIHDMAGKALDSGKNYFEYPATIDQMILLVTIL